MQIDLRKETALSLTDATKAVPSIDGKRPHTSTIWRWCRKGIRGVKLEYLRMGHRIITTEQALERFAHRLAEADEPPNSSVPQRPMKRTANQRQRDIAKAEAKLSAAGI